MPRIAVTTDPPGPAHEGPDVEALLIELARLHGISEAAERSNHGIGPEPDDAPAEAVSAPPRGTGKEHRHEPGNGSYRRTTRPEPLLQPRLCARPLGGCLLYTSPSPRDGLLSRMPSSA